MEREAKEALKTEEVLDFTQPLAKNEYETSINGDGEMRMEFGPEVPDLVKKRAMDWAKKRGLRAKEASLNKSDGANEWVVFVK